jgi:serine/threonine protein phosphatase 1
MIKRQIVIGDVHGCYYEMLDLLSAVSYNDNDDVIFVGDIVDRGPCSWEMIDWVQTHPNVQCCMGNHERKHIRSHRGTVRPSRAVTATKNHIIDLFGEQRYEEVLDFFESMPLFVQTEHALVTHGFYDVKLHIEDQDERVLCGVMSGASILERKYGKDPWYELYAKKANQPIIVGHLNYTHSDKPLVFDDLVYGLDTSCYGGGALTALVLPDFDICSVPSRNKRPVQVTNV